MQLLVFVVNLVFEVVFNVARHDDDGLTRQEQEEARPAGDPAALGRQPADADLRVAGHGDVPAIVVKVDVTADRQTGCAQHTGRDIDRIIQASAALQIDAAAERFDMPPAAYLDELEGHFTT